MLRDFSALHDPRPWEVIIIGGGASGLGIAVDAASRGFRTLLLEAADFAKGTSSRSTKLVHGGVRYLAQGDVALVREALYERGLLLQNAPQLVHAQPFVIPSYDWMDSAKYTLGLKVYDLMAGGLGLGATEYLQAEQVREQLPDVRTDGLKGGILYQDGQFDDARLAITLARTAHRFGATLLNYAPVTALLKDAGGRLQGVRVQDAESGAEAEVLGRVIVNATGVFADQVLSMDTPQHRPLLRPSQGTHLVLDGSFLSGRSAVMIPNTTDGRVLFAVPWHGQVIMGTTDVPRELPELEPRPLEQEVDFILQTAAQYWQHPPTAADIRSVFSGLRPLAAPTRADAPTKEISRSHKLIVSPSGLITLLGGKWTTYRRMAQDTLQKAQEMGLLPTRPCLTSQLLLHGYRRDLPPHDTLSAYGSDLEKVRLLEREAGEGKLHPRLPYLKAEVLWAARHEMARTLDDVLSRRTRSLLLDAQAAMECAPLAAALLARELGQDTDWQEAQVAAFRSLAAGYLYTGIVC